MKIISISNRKLCHGDFLSRLESISNSGVESIYLREKDLSQEEYTSLAEKVLKVCNNCDIYIVKYIDVAKTLNCKNIHLSYKDFLSNCDALGDFKNVSVSVHSVDEAITSSKMSATRLITGHIFATDCKKNLAPRGLEYLEKVCSSVNIPVYAIGGISPNNAMQTINYGADGVCVMSSLMQTHNVNTLVESLQTNAFLS